MIQKKNYNAIDIGKFIASILVVAIHTHPLQGIDNPFVQRVFEVITSLAVPYFFLCSSYFFFKNSDIGDYRLKIYKFIQYYVIWSVLYLPLTIYGTCIDGNTVGKKILLLFRGYFFVGENYYSWTLWYLLALIYGLLGISFLISKHVSIKGIGACSVCVYFVSCIMDYLSTNYENLSGVIRVGAQIVKISFVNGRLFTAPLYIFVGYVLSLLYLRLKSKHFILRKIAFCLIIVLGILRCFLTNLWFESWSKMAIAVCVFVVLLFVQLPDSIWFSRIRKLSVVLYFVHLYVYFIVQKVCVGRNYGMGVFLWTVGISLAIGYIVICCEKKSQLLRRVF